VAHINVGSVAPRGAMVGGGFCVSPPRTALECHRRMRAGSLPRVRSVQWMDATMQLLRGLPWSLR